MEDKSKNAFTDHDSLEILADAVSDLGYWSWWAEKLPDSFQIEFGGTQLYFPPQSPDRPPQTRIAVQFKQPTSVSFISRQHDLDDKFEWAQQLHEDKIEPPSCSHGEFTFTDTELMSDMLKQMSNHKTIHGYEPSISKFFNEPFHLIFWCGNVELAIASKEIVLLSHAGEVPVSDIAELNKKWWEYWRTYWDKKDTEDPLPKDYACEVTIPLKE